MANVNVTAIDALITKVDRFSRPDPRPLLRIWESIILNDNERGVLAGLDKDGNPLPPVTYRPKTDKPSRWTRTNQRAFKNHRVFVGKFENTAHNNLSPSEYRKLGGPPSAPRGKSFRVITNLRTESGYDSSKGVFYAVGAWFDILSSQGRQFILAHFTGMSTGGWYKGCLPVRDLRGIRPQGQAECFDELNRWGNEHTQVSFR